MKSEGYKFVTPSNPKPGDVVYVSAAMRGTSDHWAIVKYNKGDHLVLFEQNVVNGGKAGVERKLKYPSDSYKLYTPVSTGEKPDPVLKGASGSTQTTEKTTEKTTVTTTVTTTKKPTTTTTTKLTTTTTKPTTTKPTTTKPTTTKPVTTTKVTTTIPSTTVTTSAVTSVTQTTLPITETETFAVTFLNIEITENYHSFIQETASEAISENNNSSPAGKIVIGAVCAALVMGIAALVVLIIKKK